ncbi:hypothetical protein ACRRTK_004295 [Alexandromys fortis]
METSVPAPAVEKKEAKSGLLEDSSFPDPGKKACPLVVAAAAAVAAQGVEKSTARFQRGEFQKLLSELLGRCQVQSL